MPSSIPSRARRPEHRSAAVGHSHTAGPSAAAMMGLLFECALALLCAAAGLALAGHYPLAPLVAPALFVSFAAACWFAPTAWVLSIPALLPVIGLAPWSGWITFEEWDLLVLAAASAGYARMAAQRRWPRHPAADGSSPLVWLLLALFAASQSLALMRGFDDAGGFVFGFSQGYREPMNSLRLAKALFAALLLLPLWLAVHRTDPAKASRHLAIGLALGLLGASLATVWERAAFTDLLNFSADYRTTAMFWEMHVGGAALDGFLAVTVPFAIRELLVARTASRWAAMAFVILVAAYACLTTFSRGVYLAVPVGLVIMLAVHIAQSGLPSKSALWAALGRAVPGAILVVAFATASQAMFATSGYRGMMALLAATAAVLALPGALRACSRKQILTAAMAGVGLAAATWACAEWLPKGAYIAYGACTALTGLLLVRQRGQALALTGFIGMLASLAWVALHWGGQPALMPALAAVMGLLIALAVALLLPARLWPSSLRWQGGSLAAMVLAASVVATFGGGVYMTGRFATSTADLELRLQHWRHGLAMLRTPQELWLGRGLGRYVDNYALSAPIEQRPGDFRLRQQDGNGYLTTVAGNHMLGWGDVLRISQRVSIPEGPAQVRFRVRAEKATTLHFEVCMKHLLYDAGCLSLGLEVPAKPGVWQTVQSPIEGSKLTRGEFYAPRLIVFSLAAQTPGLLVDIDNLELFGSDGRNLLSNGDFSDGLSRWFSSSDRNHLPWHAKNMALHVLLDQGLVGVGLLAALCAAALLRCTLGAARKHALAPGIAGGLAALLAVGLFDSLLDIPRIAYLFYFLLLLGLTLKSPGPAAPKIS